jgi:DNA processing protein
VTEAPAGAGSGSQAGAGSGSRACERCLARSWLLGRLAGHLDVVRERISALLGLGCDELIAAVGGRKRSRIALELERFDAARARAACTAAGLQPICGCDRGFPRAVAELPSPPGVLYVGGGLQRLLAAIADEPVALVGSRRASPYGIGVARSLGRSLGAAGITVISGLAVGVDSAAHAGALDAAGMTVAVMPGGADLPYPASSRRLHARICATGAAVSELPPGCSPRRWTFLARNRIIAGLSAMTVVIEARGESASLVTAAAARELGRLTGAVPGQISSPMAEGPNQLLADGATVIRGPQDVLDALYGAGARSTATTNMRAGLSPELVSLLGEIGSGTDTVAGLAEAGYQPDRALAALASLELAGYIRRQPGGRFTILP